MNSFKHQSSHITNTSVVISQLSGKPFHYYLGSYFTRWCECENGCETNKFWEVKTMAKPDFKKEVVLEIGSMHGDQ